LGRHGRKGLGKNHGFAVSEQKNEDRYKGHPNFHKHFPTPAFNIIILSKSRETKRIS